MPADVAEVEDAIEVLDDDTIEVVDPVEEVTTTTRKRLSKANTYIFQKAEDAVAGKEKLVYEDGSTIEGFRVFAFSKAPDDFVPNDKTPVWKLKRGDNRCLIGGTVFVVARNADIAASWLIESKGWFCGLYQTIAKTGAGRAKSVIAKGMLEYGKMLSMFAYGLTPPKDGNHNDILAVTDGLAVVAGFEGQNASFIEHYGPGGKYDHYRTEDGTWKPFTKDE